MSDIDIGCIVKTLVSACHPAFINIKVDVWENTCIFVHIGWRHGLTARVGGCQGRDRGHAHIPTALGRDRW